MNEDLLIPKKKKKIILRQISKIVVKSDHLMPLSNFYVTYILITNHVCTCN